MSPSQNIILSLNVFLVTIVAYKLLEQLKNNELCEKACDSSWHMFLSCDRLLCLFTEERVGIQGNRPQDGGDRSWEGGLPENPSRRISSAEEN